MLNRNELIYALTVYELEWLISNNDKHNRTYAAEFFARGGFTHWSDEELQKQYDLFIAEEPENA